MKIIFAGTSHGYPEPDRFCSATFIDIGGKVYIIDAGAPIAPLLRRYGYRHADVRGIFVTHQHSDHFEGLPEYCTQILWKFTEADPDIYLPEQYGVDLLHHWVCTLQNLKQDRLHVHAYGNGPVYRDENMEVTAVPTRHIVNAHAFRIRAEGKELLFSGDMSYNYPEFPEILGGRHYDLVVSESAHNSCLADCAPLFRQADTDRLVINHINPAKLEGIEAVCGTFPFAFTLAHDGYTVEL